MKSIIKKLSQGLLLVPALLLGLSFAFAPVASAECVTTGDPLSSGASCAKGDGVAEQGQHL